MLAGESWESGRSLVTFVKERDMDLLLMEELWISESFRQFMLTPVGETGEGWRFLGAFQSVSDSALGESDLVASFLDSSGVKVALLIENKVGAIFQKDQPTRYRERGEEGIVRGRWSKFFSLLIAPGDYLASHEAEVSLFDGHRAYEQIAEFFRAVYLMPDIRAFVKQELLQAAILQGKRGYVPRPDNATTSLWHQYYAVASKEAPELSMAEPDQKPAKSSWIYFHPAELPSGCSLLHKMREGCVDLQLGKHIDLDLLQAKVTAPLNIVRTGKSYSIRASGVPVIRTADVSDQTESIRLALNSARTLRNWLRANRAILQDSANHI